MSSRGDSTFMPHMNDPISMSIDPLATQVCTRNPSPTTRVHPKRPAFSLSLACNFEAFSLHFHLPLKVAAEKFGVRATAFKKRCRAIGIRHWPYRKVRSLKRSLQELNRAKEQGELNEKQQYQYNTFKKQLDKLMAPETYGIDPSGRIPQHHFEEDSDVEDDSVADDDSYASQSPRYNASFTECTISPIETDKTFEFSGPSHLRSHRKQNAAFSTPSSAHLSTKSMVYSNDPPSVPFHSSATFKYPFGGYDHFLHDTTMDKLPMLNHTHTSPHVEDHFAHHPNDVLPVHLDNDALRSLHDNPLDTTNHQMDYTSERFFDDVFLQISPDYGCLV